MTLLHIKHEKWLSFESNVLIINQIIDFENNQDNLNAVFDQYQYILIELNPKILLKNQL